MSKSSIPTLRTLPTIKTLPTLLTLATLLTFLTSLTALLSLASPCCAGRLAVQEKRIVVLHSYLLPPSWAQQITDSATKTSVGIAFARADTLDASALSDVTADADLILLDVAHESVFATVATKSVDAIKNAGCPYVLIGDLTSVREGEVRPVADALNDQRPSDAWSQRIREYYRYGGPENLTHLVAALATTPDDGVVAQLTEPVDIPESGFYHPQWPRIETRLSDVQQKLTPESRPIVAIAINRATVSACDTAWLDALMDALAQRGLSSYAFFGPRKDPDRFTRMTCLGLPADKVAANDTATDAAKDDHDPDNGAGSRTDIRATVQPLPSLMINSVLVFRPQDRKRELERIGIPVLQTLPAGNRSAQAWRDSTDGLPLADISYYYASSELAGMIDPVLISARDEQQQSLQPIASQINGLADRAAALVRLQRTTPDQRRVAVFVYNYPPGENNFGASFLNVPRSLENSFQALKAAGYTTQTPTADSLTTQLQQCLQALYDRETLRGLTATDQADFVSLAEYQTWFESLPSATSQRIVDYWGTPESMAVTPVNADQKGFVIPRVSLGNAILLPQPLRHELTRATDPDLRRKRINHRSVIPLSHTYLASYLYIKSRFDAHAVIHFGTHGTQEWGPGKQRALAMEDQAMLAIADLPNIYPYIMDNLGEATTAKRRGRATMVSHLTPMFTPSGFRPGLHDMHVIMHDWETVDPGPVKRETERQLIEEFVKHKLDKDLGWPPERIASDFPGFMEVLHPYLDDVAQTAQPQGLAVFGDTPNEERRFGMVMQILRKRLIDSLGEDIDEVFLIDAEKVVNSRPARWLRLALSDPEAASRLDLREIDRLDTGSHTSVPNRAEDKKLDPAELLDLAREARRLNEMLSSNSEIEALLSALDGRHVPSGYGGDPVRNPDSLPTGRNLYGFDPVRVPTAQSWKIGQGVFDEWLQTYRAAHDGDFPSQVAFTLWAGETMRHHGVIEAQIFHALGVRPRWDSSGRMKGFDVIAAAELGRPRIDVLANVTGSYRDQFPHLMEWIDKAVVAVAELEAPADETGQDAALTANYVAAHAQRLADELVSQGRDPAVARRQATARVFSNESGTYGTGLNNAVYHSDLWAAQQRGGGDPEMTELFLHRMGHAYGEGLDGMAAADLFASQMKRLDAVFLARSSHTYGVLTSDDPFAYLGGFELAARQLSGQTPELLVQNLRDPEEVIVEPVNTAIAKEMQSRYLHPQWIRSQQQEGYSGTLQVLKATQFLWGWQAMSPDSVRGDQWQSLVDVYIDDQYQLGTQQWLQESNQQALAQISERMLEAVRLNYWTPSLQTQQTLARVYRQASRDSGLIDRNPMVTAFVAERFPDLDSPATASEPIAVTPPPSGEPADSTPEDAERATAAAPAMAATEPEPQSAEKADADIVEGLELQPQTAEMSSGPAVSPPSSPVRTYALVAMIALVAAGAARRLWQSSGRKG